MPGADIERRTDSHIVGQTEKIHSSSLLGHGVHVIAIPRTVVHDDDAVDLRCQGLHDLRQSRQIGVEGDDDRANFVPYGV